MLRWVLAMHLSEIQFPCFKLRQHEKIWEIDGVLHIKSTLNYEYVLDDKNVQGSTLSSRLLRMASNNTYSNLYSYSTIIANIKDLVTKAQNNSLMIDNSGTLFRYRNTRYSKIEWYKVKSSTFVKGKGYLVTLDSKEFTDLMIDRTCNYVAVMFLNDSSYVIYDYSDTKPEKMVIKKRTL